MKILAELSSDSSLVDPCGVASINTSFLNPQGELREELGCCRIEVLSLSQFFVAEEAAQVVALCYSTAVLAERATLQQPLRTSR